MNGYEYTKKLADAINRAEREGMPIPSPKGLAAAIDAYRDLREQVGDVRLTERGDVEVSYTDPIAGRQVLALVPRDGGDPGTAWIEAREVSE